jgi:glc operon protein GlcG
MGIVTALAASMATAAFAQTMEKRTLTLDGAKRVAAAAAAEARRHNEGGVIAVVDDGGNLMYLERLDGTFAAGARIAAGKARTAVLFKLPTRVFEEIIRKGRTPMVALQDFTPLQGGVPIVVEGQVVGAVGVSGAASAQRDEAVALAGAAALHNGAEASSATYFESQRVAAAFAKGSVLLGDEGRNYMIHASRREKPGLAEVHQQDTDIVYVLSGSATVVTGGTAVDAKTVEPGEIRGSSIRGGDVRRLSPGDVLVVPRGTPHWFREVEGPLTYYVVKVR